MSVASDARRIFRAGVRAADPYRAIAAALRRDRRSIRIAGHRWPGADPGTVRLLAFGKAAAAMADAAGRRLGRGVEEGLVVQRAGDPPPRGPWQRAVGAHPVCDARSLRAAETVERFVDRAPAEARFLVLVSGGGSAILEAPLPGLGIAELAATDRALLASGAPIQEMNAIRRHLSRVKGGRLAARFAPRPSATLAISDVVGDTPWDIASGPTVSDPTTYRAALRAVTRWRLAPRLPRGVLRFLARGARAGEPETVKPGDRRLADATFDVVASNRHAVEGAAAEARRLRYRAEIVSSTLTGETQAVARREVGRLVRAARASPAGPARAWVSGGETTVTLGPRPGKGGRNQEFALAAVGPLDGLRAVCLLSAGTDGIDGPTDAAGGCVTGETAGRMRRRRVDPVRALRRHDAYRALDAVDALLRTGPTGTNVMDLHVLLRGVAGQPGYGKK